ncbi:gp172.1 [Bacillus phage W.Ph.]|uniref:Gp172.1 n=1 Tax=Bacillus phage W.Ph. TaxID=764595 RepID=L7UYL5_9CAUD|nr:gp172.1 [Bacillus phage W.Ph.]AGC55708.1 gp172.1 [Bacillus phage W.Ph.]
MVTIEMLKEKREELQDKLEVLWDGFDYSPIASERDEYKMEIRSIKAKIDNIDKKLDMLQDNFDESAWYSSSDARLYETGLSQNDFIN